VILYKKNEESIAQEIKGTLGITEFQYKRVQIYYY